MYIYINIIYIYIYTYIYIIYIYVYMNINICCAYTSICSYIYICIHTKGLTCDSPSSFLSYRCRATKAAAQACGQLSHKYNLSPYLPHCATV